MSGIEESGSRSSTSRSGASSSRSRRTSPTSARSSTRRAALLAFKTFAYIRVGLLLGQLLVDHDLEPYDGSETWIEQLMRDPAHRARVAAEVRQVAEEIAADPRYAGEESLGPDEDARERFREFARKQLDS